jgi:hypothetical protein
VKLLLDEHYANAIALQLRTADLDVVTVLDLDCNGIDDDQLLRIAASQDRALLTNNARDFIPLVTRWSASGEEHCGVLLTADSSMPRGRKGIGLYITVLRTLMVANPGIRSLANQLLWLP